jgi:hypothetical protein
MSSDQPFIGISRRARHSKIYRAGFLALNAVVDRDHDLPEIMLLQYANWMRHILLIIFAFAAALTSVPVCHGQDTGEIGFFAEYLGLKQASTGGLGARFSISVLPGLQLEIEGAKDFRSQRFDAQFQDSSGMIVTTKMTTDGVEFLAGPRFRLSQRIPFFVSLKGGIFHFNSFLPDIPNTDPKQPNTTLPGIPLNGFTPKGTIGVFYPAIGMEFNSGPWGIRIDGGDEIFFNTGQRNNFKATVGPVFRF